MSFWQPAQGLGETLENWVTKESHSPAFWLAQLLPSRAWPQNLFYLRSSASIAAPAATLSSKLGSGQNLAYKQLWS